MVVNILTSAPRFNGMFELRNPTLGSQEIPEAGRRIWTVAYKRHYPLAFAPMCKPEGNKLLDKVRAINQKGKYLPI